MDIQWRDEFALGVGIIDDQHKKLIERAASFSRAVESGDRDAAGDTVNYLIAYAIQHFGAEELIMIRNRYDRFKEHRDEHSWFIKEVYDLNLRMADPTALSQQELTDFRDFLVRWVLDHIMKTDRDIARCLGHGQGTKKG